MLEAGCPPHVLSLSSAAAAPPIGDLLVQHPKLTRFISFTGSRDVGLWIFEQASKTPARPDLDEAPCRRDGRQGQHPGRQRLRPRAGGRRVLASAFGYQGQKCSACSRAIVARATSTTSSARQASGAEGRRDQARPPERAHPTHSGPDGRRRRASARRSSTSKRARRKAAADGGAKARATGYYVQPTVFADVPPRRLSSRRRSSDRCWRSPPVTRLRARPRTRQQHRVRPDRRGVHRPTSEEARRRARSVPRRQPLHQPQVHRRAGRRAPVRRLQHVGHRLQGRRSRLPAAVPAGEVHRRKSLTGPFIGHGAPNVPKGLGGSPGDSFRTGLIGLGVWRGCRAEVEEAWARNPFCRRNEKKD
jgi:hypothetical protein